MSSSKPPGKVVSSGVSVGKTSGQKSRMPLSTGQASLRRQRSAALEEFHPASLVTITEEHKKDVQRAFDLFDSAGTGRIKAHEVKVALCALGYDVSKTELTQLLQQVGIGVSDTMGFSEFQSVLLLKMTQRESRQECVRAFRQIDAEDKGAISLDDLRGIADSLHMNLTDDELTEMILFAQPAGAGGAGAVGGMDFDTRESLSVSEEDFVRLMKRANVF